MEDSFYTDLRAHQLDAVGALREIDKLFSANGIRYFLVAGSTLGAVRHKGFIPWDDDIDIGIFYEDKRRAYELLATISEPYTWIDRTIDPKYPRLYGKVLKDHVGLVDVFILVKTSDDIVQRKIQWASRKILFKLYKGKISYHNHNESNSFIEITKVKIARIVSHLLRREWIENAIEHNEGRFQNANTKYYLNIYSAYSLEKEMINSEWLDGADIVTFEGNSFPTVKNTDAYLKHLYGDYMTIPKIEDRVLRHEELF